jgi:hypothetical protein
MGALKTTFVLFLLLLAGATTYLSVGQDPLGGEPYQMVKVEAPDFDKLMAEAEAAQAAAQRQRQQEQLQQQQQEQQAVPQAMSQTETQPELQQTAQPQAQGAPVAGLDVPPVTGQAPPSIRIDPNAGITATDMLPSN